MDTEFFELSDYKKTGEISLSDEEKLIKAATILREGGLVAFPTETVYGLGGNALLKEASRNIYAAKGRPSDNPLIVHVADMESIAPLVKEIPRQARVLAKRFWPGPLTMIMEKSPKVPYETTGGLETVAIRMPSDKAALEFIRLAGVPVAGPSANTSGRPSPTTALHVKEDLNGRIDAIIDGGATGIGVESTIVDVSGDEPVLLRPGAITLEMLEACLKEDVDIDPALEKPMDSSVHPKAPGMKYRHYAPKAPMVIVQGEFYEGCDGIEDGMKIYEELMKIVNAVKALVNENAAPGKRIGIICSDETWEYYFEKGAKLPKEKVYKTEAIDIRSIGSRKDEKSIAHNLYAVLRAFDDENIDYIIAEGVDPRKLGYAIMNRMQKAAAQHIIRV